MIIDCISDLHGSYPKLDGGDLLIVAGDLTARDEPKQHMDFLWWLADQDYRKVVLIAGNHDRFYQKHLNKIEFATYGVTYLQDSGCDFDGLKIYGSPWTPEFRNWHFMLPRGSYDLMQKWDLIPSDTDILITHGPSYGLLDSVCDMPTKYDRVGCELLREAVERIKPKLHVFGHIHHSYGQMVLKHEGPNTILVNAAHCDEDYKPVNMPIRIEL